jgi:hypothetical protein
VKLWATPDHQVGFAPEYADPRILNIGVWANEQISPAQIRAHAARADRVFVIADGPVGSSGLTPVEKLLEPMGFAMERKGFGWSWVDVYTR